ncbi:MAG: D-tyrosyl-tRNA(Tyr) deacylase [Lachnospiraceae bacterium]|nr:D-tyrosyl-tRNA(Tyr) deacylase [Lachnospiraceae bacterium]
MRLLVQRVKQAKVEVRGEAVGKIGLGFLVLAGISDSDTEEIADRMLKKLIGLRIFEDEDGKTNLNLSQVDGELLIVSQFTLYADMRKGNRPSFIRAGKPDHANRLYEYLLGQATGQVAVVERGIFGEEMEISLINDGPFTVMLDSEELFGL